MTPALVRSLFPITRKRAYLFSGGLAPSASPVRAALDRWTELWALDPAYLYAHSPEDWELARERFASIIGAEASEIAITDSTSRGSNLVVQMIEAPPGSNVVVDEFTYASSFHPWRLPSKSHVEIRSVPAREHRVRFNDLAHAVDQRTVAVSISHVSWQSGFRHDLEAVAELAHKHGAYLIVDAAQSAGAIEIDVHRMGVDFLSCLAMKWLLGTPGLGFLFVAHEHFENFTPPQVGYAGLENAFRSGAPLLFRRGAAKYELSLPSLSGLAASRAGMEILLGVGMRQIQEYVLDLSGYTIEQLLKRGLHPLTPVQPELRAGVVALHVLKSPELVNFLRKRAVDIWSEPSSQLVRIDPHIFNNRDDVDRFLEGLDEFIELHGQISAV
jgi:selenocysteine lyase/cysteine desulfurase